MSNKEFNLDAQMQKIEHRISSLETWQGRNLGPKLSEQQWTDPKEAPFSVALYKDKFQGASDDSNLDVLQLKIEKEKLNNENDMLKTQIAKLNYRIKHLIRSLDEAEANASKDD